MLHRISSNVRTAVPAKEGVIPEAVHMIPAEIPERYEVCERFLYSEYGLAETDLKKLKDMYPEC